MAEGNNIIGRVSVKVTPDTRGFGRETANKLRAIRDKNAREFKVQVTADTSKVEAQIDRFIAQQNARLLADDKRIKFRTKLEISRADMRADVKRSQEFYQTMADKSAAVKYETKLDTSGDDVFSEPLRPKFDLSHLEDQISKAFSRASARQVIVDRKAVVRTADLGSSRFWDGLEARIKGEKTKLPLEVDETRLRKDLSKVQRRIDKLSILDLKMGDKGLELEKSIDRTTRAIANQQALVRKLRNDWEDFLRVHSGDTADAIRREREIVEAENEINRLQRERMGMAEQLGRLYSKISKTGVNTTELEAGLQRIKKQLADFDPKVKLELDENALQGLQKRTAEAFKNLDAQKVKLFDRTDDFREMANAYQAQRRETEAIRKNFRDIQDSGEANARLYSKVANELADAERKMASLASNAQRLYKERAPFSQRVNLDRSSALKLEAEWRALKKTVEEQKASLKVDLDNGSSAKVKLALALLARTRTVGIKVRMEGASALQKMLTGLSSGASQLSSSFGTFLGRSMGLRLLYQTALDIFDIVPRLDMMIPALAKNLSVATVAVSGLTWALGGLFTSLVDAARSFQVLLAAPALLAGLGAMGFVVVQAFKDFGTQLPKVTAQYEALKKSASSNFWKTAKADMQAFFDTAMPLFEKWAPSVSQGVGKMVGALAQGLNDGFAKQGDRFFTNLNKSMSSAEGGFKALGSAMSTLIGAGSDSFDGLGKWFTKTMESFDSWAKKNDANGNITRWITEGTTALKQLGSILLSTLSIFRSVADIFRKSGFPGLEELDRGLKGVSKTLQDPGFQKKAMYPLERMNEAMGKLKTLAPEFGLAMENAWRMLGDSIGTLSGPVTDLLRGIFDGFNSPTFQQGFDKFITGMGDFIKDITPGFEHLVSEFGSLLGLVGTGAASWGPAMNSLLEMVANAGSAIHPGLEEFIKSTGPKLKEVIDEIAPKVEELAKAIGDLLGDEDFQEFVNDIIEAAGDLIKTLLDVGKWVVDLGQKFVDWYGTLDDGKQKIVAMTTLLGLLGGALGIKLALKITWIVASAVVQAIANQVASWVAGTLAPAIVRKIKPIAVKVPIKPIAIMGGAILAGVSIALLIADIIPANWAIDLGGAIGKALAPNASEVIDKFTEKVKSEWGDKSLLDVFISVITGKGTGSKTLDGAAKAGWDMLWTSLKTNLQAGAESIVSRIESWKPILKGFDFLATAWGWIWDWFTGGNGGKGGGGSGTSGMTGKVSGAISGMGPDVTSGLQQGWNQLISKILSWSPISTVIDWVKKIIQWLFGAGIDLAGLGSGIAAQFGVAVDIVVSGIQQGYEKIKSAAEGVANGGLGIIGKALGVDDLSIDHVKAGMDIIGSEVGRMKDNIVGHFTETRNQSAVTWDGLVNQGLGAWDRFNGGTSGKLGELMARVGSGTASARDTGVQNLNGLGTGGSAAMGALVSSAATKMGELVGSVASGTGSAKTQGSSNLSSLSSSAANAFSQIAGNAASKGGETARTYADAMNRLRVWAEGAAGGARSGVISRLTFSLSGQGNSSGASFTGGLSGALSRAAGIAAGAAASVKGNLAVNAYSSGAAIGQTLVDGLRSKIGAAVNAAASLAGAIRGHLPNSPAKEGPFSGSGWGGWGESIADELANGLRRGAPAVAAEAAAMMTDVSNRLTASPEIDPSFARATRTLNATRYAEDASPTGGVNLNVNVTSTADDPLVEGARLGRDLTFALKGAGF